MSSENQQAAAEVYREAKVNVPDDCVATHRMLDALIEYGEQEKLTTETVVAAVIGAIVRLETQIVELRRV